MEGVLEWTYRYVRGAGWWIDVMELSQDVVTHVVEVVVREYMLWTSAKSAMPSSAIVSAHKRAVEYMDEESVDDVPCRGLSGLSGSES